jgi:polysaccharide export outer membrane protein
MPKYRTYQLHRFSPLSLVSLYAKNCTIYGTVLLWTALAVSANATVSQSFPDLAATPLSQSNDIWAQLPSAIPSVPFDPVAPLQPPVESSPPQSVPPTEFNRYRLGPGDSITVSVQNFPNLSFQATINTDGNILVPLVGTLRVAGLTVEQAQDLIRARLNRYVIEPEVAVVLQAQRPVNITVIGEVVRPGYYALNPNSQLIAALQVAGGSSNVADLRSVVVRRSINNNSTIEQKVDLFTPLQNGQSLPDLRLQDGDVVLVQRLDVGSEQNYDRQLVSRSGLAQQQITIRVLSYANQRIGTIALPNGSTFLDALAAIAPNPDATNLGKIALVRFDPERGKAVTQMLDGKRALMGDLAQNVPLQNNDVFVVGRTLIAKLEYALSTITRPINDTLQFLFFFDRLTR